jgi:hypothetical protein
MNDEPLNIAQCFDYLKQPYMVQFFEIYACEPSSFLHCVLTTIGASSGSKKVELQIRYETYSRLSSFQRNSSSQLQRLYFRLCK